MSWVPPYAYMNLYPSRERYDTRAYYPSYSESSHQGYPAPRRSTFDGQLYNQGRFTQKESVRSSWKKKEMVHQVYQVKRDGRKDVVSDSTPSNQKPAEKVLATKGKEAKRVTFKDPVVESRQTSLEVPKANKEFQVHETRSQPRRLLVSSRWQRWQLNRLRAGELEKRNMAWISKQNSAKLTGVKEDAQEATKRATQKPLITQRVARNLLGIHQTTRNSLNSEANHGGEQGSVQKGVVATDELIMTRKHKHQATSNSDATLTELHMQTRPDVVSSSTTRKHNSASTTWKNLKKLGAQELEKMSMAWVPKKINQTKNDV
jgi:hypothetical protein